MIRVNLIRNRVQESSTQVAATSLGGPSLGESREWIVKIAFVVLFTLGLIIYENQNLRGLNEESARMQARLNQMQTEANEKAAALEKVKDIEGQARELEDKLKILKLLSKLRLREVKTLDFVQSSIPEKVWLKSVTYESDRDHMEAGHFQFSGQAVSTENLTEFVKRLDDSAYLMDVIVVKNQELPMSKAAVIREFLFTAEVESKN